MIAAKWMNFGNINYAKLKKPVTKDHILCDSVYRKCLEYQICSDKVD